MKKFKFSIRGNEYDVEILNIEDNIAEIDVNGSTYKVELKQEIKTSKTPRLVRSNVTHEPTERISKPNEKKGTGQIKAPLPGTIVEVKVKVGADVKSGDTLLIMEAMKMENNIKADRDGKVTEIKVNNGDSVLEGDVLVEIGGN